MFCLDTSSLIHAWVRSYPIDRFPTLWDQIENAAVAGALCASVEVKHEIGKKRDDLFAWSKTCSIDFCDIDEEIQDNVLQILSTHPRLLNVKAGKSGADPFVIATAMAKGAIVVTEEDSGGPKNPKIPLVCDAYGVKWMNVLSLIRELDMVF
jgi:predicted nucleic acid-binding protein